MGTGRVAEGCGASGLWCVRAVVRLGCGAPRLSRVRAVGAGVGGRGEGVGASARHVICAI
eukprot:4579637-Prymnesium_polylepis.1